MTDPILARVSAQLDALAGSCHRIGIALSGGGDSVALLQLSALWAKTAPMKPVLKSATVDHGLRADSRLEAQQAGLQSQQLGVAHSILHWQRDDLGRGNLMAQARDARLRLLSDWARAEGLDAVLLGHTLDDQAETFLMRLARGAGVDGLAGMAPAREAQGMIFLRPMLEIARAELRDWLSARAIGWIDDPSNENRDFERVRMRQALATLGLPLASFAQTLGNLGMARDALRHRAAEIATQALAENSALFLPLTEFLAAPEEIRRRLLVAGLRWINGADYPARRDKIAYALTAIQAGRKFTLEGAVILPRGDRLVLMREVEAASRAACVMADANGQAVWDGRWQVSGLGAGQELRALGYGGLAGLDWRSSGMARDVIAASPGLYQSERLIAAPLLKTPTGVVIRPYRDLGQFQRLLFSH